ncbi:hypothetical protein OHB00_16635 [Streptomyces sp. NBC_00631]
MSEHRNRRAARVVAFGAAGAPAVAAGVTAVASASRPASTTAATC